ncbi:imidazolonepropionase [Hyphomonas sp.]|uniref:imidazolonepropionase n=1 Tax=Hyphomonas sp. TaxID=87 RepID=UPI000C5F7312|nr:imidazolonepropionase [Hyphomonas sp.]MAU67311.1 imidazolonepropionase [Hyphomonas sp.]MBM57051.1 imidazolonepropionase [Hyphomonas sp.]
MLLTHAKLATLEGNEPYGLVPDGAVWIKDGQLRWVGTCADIPEAARTDEHLDLEGRLVTPGLVDCHTHIVHAGNRSAEFEARLNGASYEEISRSGGGIVSTVEATRAASEADLLRSALLRVDALIAEGVTTLEIKSGYGLDIETELKMLRVARQVEKVRPLRVRTTFLGAHTLPREYAGRPDDYLSDVCLPAMEGAKAEGLADAVDGFCETIAFSPQDIRTVFEKARTLGLPVKLHAEQLSWLGGARLAAEYAALSCDHLEYATPEDAEAMQRHGSIAVLLPGAFYFLQETRLPPVSAFREHDVPMAIATDCNPGSSPMTSLLSAMNMSCVLFRLTPEEALRGVTRNGAMALGLEDVGRMHAGQSADLAVWDVEHPAELSCRIGFNPLYKRIFCGEVT